MLNVNYEKFAFWGIQNRHENSGISSQSSCSLLYKIKETGIRICRLKNKIQGFFLTLDNNLELTLSVFHRIHTLHIIFYLELRVYFWIQLFIASLILKSYAKKKSQGDITSKVAKQIICKFGLSKLLSSKETCLSIV